MLQSIALRVSRTHLPSCTKLCIFGCALLFLLSSCKPAPDNTLEIPSPLLAPDGFTRPITLQAENSSSTCELLPAFTARLTFPSRYAGSDKARDQVNPSTTQVYLQQSKPIREFSLLITRLANQLYAQQGSNAEYACLIAQLYNWSQSNSLLNVADMTGMAVRKWTLAALSSNYLKLSYLHRNDQTLALQRKAIERWFSAVAWQVVSDYSDKPIDRINNHSYWAAWSVMVTSVIVQDQKLFIWSKQIYSQALGNIDERGLITSELKRATRAAHYQNFALAPLVAISALLQANQILEENAMKKVALAAETTLELVYSSELIAAATGSTQVAPELTTRGRLAWLPILLSFHHSETGKKITKSYHLKGNSRLGGDTFALFQPLVVSN
ncbi:alginate lyase family protein [Alteromonas flava]|uniref:alginate lyase family protein n=1 Tax=Alteromonas flava TaxID=2048003 RepID=UPI000C287ECF|nr:alginate lyase family protein [Alteromonas flava]